MSEGALRNQVALITGGAHGIGAGIATLFAASGAKVLLADIDFAKAQDVARSIGALGEKAEALSVDLSSRDSIIDMMNRAGAIEPRLDILIHNAGIVPRIPVEELAVETLTAAIDINLVSFFWLVQAALPRLKNSSNARIIVTSSIVGNTVGVDKQALYGATKAGLTGLVRNLAIELGPFGITVNSVEPGMIVTDRTAAFFNEEARARLRASIPARILGSPADVANAMLFLALPASRYVTGVSLPVDGGVRLCTGG